MTSKRKRHTFVVYVEDKPGVLNRVASLFRRRAFNIDSLTGGHSETISESRMTIVVESDASDARRAIGAVFFLFLALFLILFFL